MRWFSLASLKALVSEITARENSNMQAVNDTFSEVYDNMETLDGRIDALEHKTDAAYLGNCYCGTIKKCESGKITKEQLQKSIQSWTGHAGHADSYNLRKKIETLAEAAIEKAA